MTLGMFASFVRLTTLPLRTVFSALSATSADRTPDEHSPDTRTVTGSESNTSASNQREKPTVRVEYKPMSATNERNSEPKKRQYRRDMAEIEVVTLDKKGEKVLYNKENEQAWIQSDSCISRDVMR